jgi:hypothetical protein
VVWMKGIKIVALGLSPIPSTELHQPRFARRLGVGPVPRSDGICRSLI